MICADLKLRDVVAGMGACTNSSFAKQYQLPGDYAPIASYRMLQTAVDTAKQQGIDLIVGNLYSSDTFYDEREDSLLRWQKMGVLAVEMEAAALYMNAALSGKEALAISYDFRLSVDWGEQYLGRTTELFYTDDGNCVADGSSPVINTQ